MIFWLSACGGTGKQVAPAPDSKQTLSDYLLEQDFHGSVIVEQQGEILFSGGFGLANRGTGLKNSPTTQFRLASVSKTITAIAAMLLVQQGKLDLQQTLDYWWPAFPRASEITVRQLMNHSAGLPDYASWRQYLWFSVSPEDLVAHIASLAEGSEARIAYSNSHMAVLGAIIERISGQSYADFIDARIFEPLGMHDSAYGANLPDGEHRAVGYYGGGRKALPVNMEYPYSAGGLVSTVEDMLVLETALRQHSLLNETTTKTLFTVDHPETAPGFALGWIVNDWKFDRPAIYHTGIIDGFHTVWARFPDSQASIVILSNFERNDVESLAYHLARRLLSDADVAIVRDHLRAG